MLLVARKPWWWCYPATNAVGYSPGHHLGATNFTTWRIAFFIPALFQILIAFAILIYGQDLPEGNFRKRQQSGVVPNDSFWQVLRSLGLISGLTGGGGNLGAVVTQFIFFTGSKLTQGKGITYMGYTMIGCTLPIWLIYFPPWGGMICGPSTEENAAEENYYSSEWNSQEQQRGLHQASMRFAANCRSKRGRRVRPTSMPFSGRSPSHI
ncbi:High-affinity nitrate transporter 2.2 [Thalictrum thalictroides]|uniref:High-affinity nitrate transporter 2.2 n=1 Tax=Thalictrum thalictroides TaxID=46969 RepID=A0A7J6WUS3_THATH|nr:High-affinity nitrate transporter 2.2 [Thalictrum thalictroides]